MCLISKLMKRATFLIKTTMHRQIKSGFLLKFAGSPGKCSCWKLMGCFWLRRSTLLFLLVLSHSYTRFIDYTSADNVISHLPTHKHQQQSESFCTLCKMPTHSLAQGTFCLQLPSGTRGPSWYIDHPNSGKLSF